jgi:hypothetical protein
MVSLTGIPPPPPPSPPPWRSQFLHYVAHSRTSYSSMNDAQSAAMAAVALRPLRHPTLFLAALLLIGCLGLLSGGGGGPSRYFPAGQWETAAVENSSSRPLPPPDERETCWCDAQYRGLLADPGLRNTTCGLAAFARGPGQKVVGFTYYEEVGGGGGGMEAERGYFRGIVENLQLIRYVRAYNSYLSTMNGRHLPE